VSTPSLEETLKIARSLTHSGFTQAKADQVVAGIEQAIADNEARHSDYTIELRGPELFDPNVAHDEIDEDPPQDLGPGSSQA
jgi:hypothetical protein